MCQITWGILLLRQRRNRQMLGITEILCLMLGIVGVDYDYHVVKSCFFFTSVIFTILFWKENDIPILYLWKWINSKWRVMMILLVSQIFVGFFSILVNDKLYTSSCSKKKNDFCYFPSLPPNPTLWKVLWCLFPNYILNLFTFCSIVQMILTIV